jgi:hypothetical protein
MKRYRIEHEVSATFQRVARRFHLSPQQLAELLCDDFAARPPKELIIVSYGSKPGVANGNGANGHTAMPQSKNGHGQWRAGSFYVQTDPPNGDRPDSTRL